jgi:HAD superfamily hydrolase (TIGR01509 family)
MKEQNIILFDVDGVLIDSMPIWDNSANLYLQEVHGIDAPKEVDEACATMSLMEAGEYLLERYPQLALSPAQIGEEVAAFIRERYWKAPERPGMIGIVRQLWEQGYTMYLATASEEQNVRGALTNLGVWDCFSDIYTCTEIGYSKNYAAYYEEVAKRIGVNCEELVMVEDSLHSMVTAKKAGLIVVGVYEPVSAGQVAQIKEVSDVYLDNLGQLPAWLKQLKQ